MRRVIAIRPRIRVCVTPTTESTEFVSARCAPVGRRYGRVGVMYDVGIDLAWGLRRPTGLAVLDDSGRLIHISSVRDDDEIDAAVGEYVAQDCLVSIDAPLIVTNATGNRPGERALNADFARFDAGAHPSNTSKAELAQPRGADLCQRWGLDVDPGSTARRRAIEVYPHPATIALFGLGRTLKYKQKSGRSFADLQAALTRLTRLVEGLGDREPALSLDSSEEWAALMHRLATATRKSDLRVVEDQVDAVVCAYVGRYARLRPHDTTTYGDGTTGYIVTPTLPADQVPTPRPPRPTPAESHAERVDRAVRDYAAQRPELVIAAQHYVDLVTSILDDAGINYLSITGRAKDVASFAGKATRLVDGQPAFTEPAIDIADQIGIRVITYVHRDVAAVADLLDDQVVVLDDRDLGDETASEGRFGYSSRHLMIGLDAERSHQQQHAPVRGRSAQVQIRTVLQHAWAEFEHDIRYKGQVPDEHRADFDRRFTLAAGLLELADREFSTIRDRLHSAVPPEADQDDDPRISPRDLAAFLAGQYADAGWSRIDHYDWIARLLLELGITSLTELAEALRPLDAEALNERMNYRYPPGAVRRLDDALLASFGEGFVRLHGNAHRVDALRGRLAKLVDDA